MHVEIATFRSERLQGLLETVAGRRPARLLPAIARGVKFAADEILGKAIRERFTGKGPFPLAQNKLGVKTGRLRRDLRATKPMVNLRTGEVSVRFCARVVYYPAHEFGFKGAVQVRAHTRRTGGSPKIVRGKLSKASTAAMKDRVRGQRAGYSYVKAHGRKVNIPARRPLGTQLSHVTSRAAWQRNIKNAIAAELRAIEK